MRSAARRCSGFHIGRSQKNQAPNKELHLTRPTQELLGSALCAQDDLSRDRGGAETGARVEADHAIVRVMGNYAARLRHESARQGAAGRDEADVARAQRRWTVIAGFSDRIRWALPFIDADVLRWNQGFRCASRSLNGSSAPLRLIFSPNLE